MTENKYFQYHSIFWTFAVSLLRTSRVLSTSFYFITNIINVKFTSVFGVTDLVEYEMAEWKWPGLILYLENIICSRIFISKIASSIEERSECTKKLQLILTSDEKSFFYNALRKTDSVHLYQWYSKSKWRMFYPSPSSVILL